MVVEVIEEQVPPEWLAFQPNQRAFLRMLPEYYGSTPKTALALGLNTDTPYGWMEQNQAFAEAVRTLKETRIGDMLEDEAISRAMEAKSKMADVLLMFAVKRFRPEYRDTLDVKHSGAILHANLNVNELAPEDRIALLNLAVSHEQRQLDQGTPPPTDDG